MLKGYRNLCKSYRKKPEPKLDDLGFISDLMLKKPEFLNSIGFSTLRNRVILHKPSISMST
jgi:hypothetical protein